VQPRLVFWETHTAALAEVVHPDVLIDLEVAYGYVEMLGGLLAGIGQWTGSDAEFRNGAAEMQRKIKDGRDALLPYAARRGLAEVLGLRRASMPEPVEPISEPSSPSA
jgi:hypothetical protein